MEAYTQKYKVTFVSRNKTRLFGDMMVGDVFQIIVPINYAGRSRNGAYGQTLVVCNLTQNTKDVFRFSEMDRVLKLIDYVEQGVYNE